MSEIEFVPDVLFEVSWEVCNKVGGIHTVVATKAATITQRLGDKYITIGPDFQQDYAESEFEEDQNLYRAWRQTLYQQGIRIRVGRWKIPGTPVAILIDFTTLFSSKDDVLKQLWEDYQVDSISGQWDYVEPVLFGYLSGQVIESFIDNLVAGAAHPVAHFHEWMTCSGALYLKKKCPEIATVMTTHATVMGRCIAGNGMNLYKDLSSFNSDELARRFNVVAKHSIEKIAAESVDAFVTVSQITANECKYLLRKDADVVTPNGFEKDFVWTGDEYHTKRREARESMIKVAESCLGCQFKSDPLIVGTSGRFEFRNKGLDVFFEALKKVAVSDIKREILVYVTVPALNHGARNDLQQHLLDGNAPIDPSQYKYSTHYIDMGQCGQITNAINGSVLDSSESKVKVIFVPTYLNKDDGIFNKDYYELLIGMDLTIFPSYYEPWGYTPLESIAFSIPTITSSLAGFGAWIKSLNNPKGIYVVERNDTNFEETSFNIAKIVKDFSVLSEEEVKRLHDSVYAVAEKALWSNMIAYYDEAYSLALEGAAARMNTSQVSDGGERTNQINFVRQQTVRENPIWQRVLIETTLPERLRPLEELSRNLWWCWNSDAREMFAYVDSAEWDRTNHNPIELLNKIPVERLNELLGDEKFLKMMDGIYARYQTYMTEKPDPKLHSVAYFSMEYGLHHTLKIYSGGLGILAGDYLKEASDKNVPMVAVGLLYRYGYFTQRLSAQGEQEAAYEAQNFSKLPILPARDAAGNWVSISIAFPGRNLNARVWKCQVGRTPLYLLDTDYEANIDEDRQVTHHLYGGDWENRLKQEILLGVGGVRALVKMGIKQEVYHCNEGHAAFIGVERIRNLMARKKLSFSEAMEVIRSSSLFTTHTPVPAGHDAFPESMIRQYMSHYPDVLGITWDQYINLGKMNPNDPNDKFSMSVLACNLSQEVNGVSWLHGEVSKEILGGMWPGYFKNELHIGYVTNGVHFNTWASARIRKMYSKYFPEGFSGHDYDIPAWKKVYNIPDEEFWSVKMSLKQRLIDFIKDRYTNPTQVRFDSPRQLVQIAERISPNVLTIGFARRFATYKRAHLLFTNLDRLNAIVNNPKCPVQFIFAGKAHPNDKPGQDLIKRIVEISLLPQFVGKIIFLQNYDMDLARKLVQGVDVWLNTPTRPLEASGTSGEKCVMNGTMQFSVLDGWWVEGYKEGAGWSLPMKRTFTDQNFQNELDAETIYNTIEEQIVPLYYDRDENGIPHEWVKWMKKCVSEIASNFTTNRMINDYIDRFYSKLGDRKKRMIASNYQMARRIAAWKRGVSAVWDSVRVVDVKRVRTENSTILVGEKYRYEVLVDIATLTPEDIGVEMVVAKATLPGEPVKVSLTKELEFIDRKDTIARYAIEHTPVQTGMFDIALRVFPKNKELPYRMDFALVKWA